MSFLAMFSKNVLKHILQLPGARDNRWGQAAYRPESLGRMRLRKKTHRKIRVLKGFGLYQGTREPNACLGMGIYPEKT